MARVPNVVDDVTWQHETACFTALLGEVAAQAISGVEKLERNVDAMHPAHEQQSSSVLAVLWQTVVHNSYHLGQIALLRRSLGAWPPPGGGRPLVVVRCTLSNQAVC